MAVKPNGMKRTKHLNARGAERQFHLLAVFFENILIRVDTVNIWLSFGIGGMTMTLTEMFTICDSCAYSPCLCGNDPENCVAYVMRTSHTNTLIGKYTTVHDGRTDNG